MANIFLSKKIIIPAIIFFGGLLIVSGVLILANFSTAQLSIASQSLQWTQNVGAGLSVPTCGSSSVSSTCVNGQPVATISWANDLGLHPGSTCDSTSLHIIYPGYEGPEIYGKSCDDSYSFNGELNTVYSYVISAYYDGSVAPSNFASGSVTTPSYCAPPTGCTSDGSCNAPVPACEQTTTGTDNCGTPCSKTGPACPPAAPTLSFTANPTSITQGASSILTWTPTNASSCWGSGGGIDGWKSNTGGSQTVWPSSNTTYYMECWNSAGTSSGQKSATVNVSAPSAPFASLSQSAIPPQTSPNTTTSDGATGQPFTLTWGSSNVTSCSMSKTINGGTPVAVGLYSSDMASYSDAYHLNGSGLPSPWVLGTHIFTFSCTGPNGPASDSETHYVVSPNAPTINLSRSPTALSQGQTMTVSWSTTNATSLSFYCTGASNPWTGSNQPVALQSAPYTNTWDELWNAGWQGAYSCTWTATGPGGTATAPDNFNILPPGPAAPTLTFTANPTSITQGASSILTWTPTNASSCWGSGGGIDGWKSNTGGNQTVWPSSNTTYYMECWNSAGTSSGQKSATVYVSAPPVPPPGNFSLNTGGSVSCNSVPLSWTTSSGANGYRILRGSPRVNISPYQPYTALNFTDTTVSQNTTYLYQIEAYNSGGTNRSNTINVTTPYCPPTLNFSADRTSIWQGQSVTLSWSTSYVTSCAASGAWSGSKPLNGSEVVVPLPPPSVSYTMTCSGPSGSIPGSITINIAPLLLPDWKEIIPR